jgi:polyhydroxybutyrate depolymerase
MKTIITLFAILLAGLIPLVAQSNVRAHYANGQVWVVWDVQDAVLANCVPTLTPALSNGVPVVVSNCLPATYAIYWSENQVTNTTTATLVGRLFVQEWAASILRDNVNASFGVRPTGFRIPDGAGGYRVLATNEGLFVHSVRSNHAGYYAVRPFGVSNVPVSWRAPLTNAFFDLADPPTCHLQARGTNEGYPVEWWTMWVDGDTHLAAARPDFPIMENDKRRGIPHNFSITTPRAGSLPAANVPACVAFHSGDGQAKMWLPENNGFHSIGLAPAGQLLIAVEDRFFSIKNGVVDAESITAPGYVPSFDPFFDHQVSPALVSPPEQLPASDELVVPYPLYRLNWTLDWLYAHKNVDSNRVALVGHSGGGKGSLLWSHASPERFAYVGLYNPAIGGPPFSVGSVRQIGTLAQNLPLLLTNHTGQLVRVADTHGFAASFSPLRDLPFTRLFHGKREENWALDGDQNGLSDLAQTFRQADAHALGAASFWDLRRHGMDTWTYATLSNDVAHPNNCAPNPTVDISASWGIEDLWVPTLATQFRRDDATNQIRHRADRSYPAFFNCELRGGHEDIGAVIYTNNSGPYLDSAPYDGLVTTTECLPPWIGNARGTFGGYFDWEPDLTDTETNWSAVLFLVGPSTAFNPVEVCPDAARIVDVAVRRPQLFKPLTGTQVNWELRNAANNILFQSGVAIVGADDLVSIPSLTIPRDPFRARLTITAPSPVPPCALPPTLHARMLTNALLELRWEACDTNYQYQVEQSRNFSVWRNAGPPYAAPPGGGWLTNIVSATNDYVFFRVRADALTNSPVPSVAGIYPNLFVTHDGLLRHYRLMIPTNYNPAVSNALALILHGHGQTADSFASLHPALFFHAQTNNLILVLPGSTTDERSTGWNNRDPAPGEYQVNDVSYLLALIDLLDATLTLDHRRLYAGGFSSGGIMTHYLGARTTNVFAALAAVEASIGAGRSADTIVTNPPAAGPMPTLILNCTNSCARPYWGGQTEEGAFITAAIDAAYYWTNASLCAAAMTANTNSFATNGMRRFEACDNKPPVNVLQPNQVIVQRWGNCSPDAEVIFVTLTDGGHIWPNRGDNVGFDANAEVLRFFMRHQR